MLSINNKYQNKLKIIKNTLFLFIRKCKIKMKLLSSKTHSFLLVVVLLLFHPSNNHLYFIWDCFFYPKKVLAFNSGVERGVCSVFYAVVVEVETCNSNKVFEVEVVMGEEMSNGKKFLVVVATAVVDRNIRSCLLRFEMSNLV